MPQDCRALRHIGDHIADLAFRAQGLGGDVDAVLAQHTVDACQHTRKIRMQVGDAEIRLDVGQGDLRQIHRQHGGTLEPIILKTLGDELSDGLLRLKRGAADMRRSSALQIGRASCRERVLRLV